jgi:hypothetical protein
VVGRKLQWVRRVFIYPRVGASALNTAQERFAAGQGFDPRHSFLEMALQLHLDSTAVRRMVTHRITIGVFVYFHCFRSTVNKVGHEPIWFEPRARRSFASGTP